MDNAVAFDLVEKNSEGRYRATLEPWWADGNDREEPYMRKCGRWQTVVEEAIHRSGKIDSLSTDEYTHLYIEHQTPAELPEALGWERFIPYLDAYCLDGVRIETEPSPSTWSYP